MRSYLSLLESVLTHGVDKPNRTGIVARSSFVQTFTHHMSDGFPLLTTKRMNFEAVVGELLGFIRGYDSAAQFEALGCPFWHQNANENQPWLDNPWREGLDDLGRIYGVQWREWRAPPAGIGLAYRQVDQLQNLVDKLRTDPNDRRLIVTAWNPGELDTMALPPCHLMFQCWYDPTENELSLCMYQRSCDLFLGVPYNIASYGLLLLILCTLTGYKPGWLKIILADCHIYENHFQQVCTQLNRVPYSLPEVVVAEVIKNMDLYDIQPYHIDLREYRYHPFIKADMAV
jgi:thymidylate synthase